MAGRLVSAAATGPLPRVIVPPGWAAIPVGADNDDTAREVFREAWRTGPRDSIGPFIHRLEEWLVSVLDDARDAGCFRVILPLGVPWQVPVSTAISLSFAPAARPAGGEQRLTDAGPAWRAVTDLPVADADPESLALLRTIEYTWPLPDGAGMLIAFASISGQPVAEFAPVADALTVLVETMLDALDWPPSGGAPSATAPAPTREEATR